MVRRVSFWFSLLMMALAAVPVLAVSASPTPTPAPTPEFFPVETPPSDFLDSVSFKKLNPLPLVYVDGVSVRVEQDNTIHGTFNLQNNETASVGNIQYEIQLIQALPASDGQTLFIDTPAVFDRFRVQDTYAVGPNETKPVDFSYNAGFMPAGNYRLRIQLYTTNERKLAANDTPITLTGDKSFAVIETGEVNVKATDPISKETKSVWAPLEGPNVDPGAGLAIKGDAVNIGKTQLQGTITLATSRLLNGAVEPTVVTKDTITLEPGTSQGLVLPVTAADQPGSYRILLSIIDANGQRVSGLGEFRYVVKGASASIASQMIEYLPIHKGDSGQVAFTVAGSADRATDITGSLEATITDDGGEIGSVQNTLALHGAAPAQGEASIPLQKDRCGVPTLTLTMKNSDGTVLASYAAQYPNLKADCGTVISRVTKVAATHKGLVTVVGLVVLLALLMVGWALLKSSKRKHKTYKTLADGTPLVWLLLIGAGITGLALSRAPTVQANGIQFTYAGATISAQDFALVSPLLTVSSPVHNSTVNSGTIYYAGQFTWMNCDNVGTGGNFDVWGKKSPGKATTAPTTSSPDYANMVHRTVNLPPVCPSCHGNQYFRQRVLSFAGNLTLPYYAPGTSTTIWTIGNNAGSWWGMSVLQDLTWLNFAPAPTPVPATPTPSVPSPVSGGGGSSVDCPDNSPEVVIPGNSTDGVQFTNTGNSGPYRIEVYSPTGLTDTQYTSYTWGNTASDTTARWHGSDFWIVKNATPIFTNTSDGLRVSNSNAAISSLHPDPPYSSNRSLAANAARGVDTVMSLNKGDYLNFIVNEARATATSTDYFTDNRGSIHVRVCPYVLPPADAVCPAGSPQTTVPATSANGAASGAVTADGTYRVEIYSPTGLSDADYKNYTWGNWPTDDRARWHGSSVWVIKNAAPAFGTDTDPVTAIAGGQRVNNYTTYIDSLKLDPPYDQPRTKVADASRGFYTLLNLKSGDYVTYVVNAINGITGHGAFSNNVGGLVTRICQVMPPTPTPTPPTPTPTTGGGAPTPTPTPAADLSVTMQGPASAQRGSAVGYAVNVKNNGPSVATGVKVTVPIPTGFTYNAGSSSSSCTSGGSTVTCTVDTLGAGNTGLLSVVLNSQASLTCNSKVQNTAQASSSVFDPNLGNNSATSNQTTITCTECEDGIDNDGDARIDSADPACHVNNDINQPYDPSLKTESDPQCSDLKDNDGDGLIDAADPNCHVNSDSSNAYVPSWNNEAGGAPFAPGGFKVTK